MTAKKLQDFVLHVSNNTWTRYWLHYNHPQEKPWLMAISCIDSRGDSIFLSRSDMERHGFKTKEVVEGREFWIAERTDEDGTPFKR